MAADVSFEGVVREQKSPYHFRLDFTTVDDFIAQYLLDESDVLEFHHDDTSEWGIYIGVCEINNEETATPCIVTWSEKAFVSVRVFEDVWSDRLCRLNNSADEQWPPFSAICTLENARKAYTDMTLNISNYQNLFTSSECFVNFCRYGRNCSAVQVPRTGMFRRALQGTKYYAGTAASYVNPQTAITVAGTALGMLATSRLARGAATAGALVPKMTPTTIVASIAIDILLRQINKLAQRKLGV